MDSPTLPLALLALHTAVAVVAVAAAFRSRAFTRSQLALQSLLALLVPVVGAVVVIANARDALAPPPPPDESRFDRNYTGSGD